MREISRERVLYLLAYIPEWNTAGYPFPNKIDGLLAAQRIPAKDHFNFYYFLHLISLHSWSLHYLSDLLLLGLLVANTRICSTYGPINVGYLLT